jgi:hypothetical protein
MTFTISTSLSQIVQNFFSAIMKQIKLDTTGLDNILFDISDIGKYRKFLSILSNASFALYLYFV